MDCDAVTYEELFGAADEPLTDLEDLDPLPKKRRQRPKRPQTHKDILRGLERQDLESVSTARRNTVTFPGFDFVNMVKAAYGEAPSPSTHKPESVTSWTDDRPRMGLDANGIPIVLHIPRWQRGQGLNLFSDTCHQLAEVIRPTTKGGADKNGRNRDSSYRRRVGQRCGQIKMVTGWQAIGHPTDPPTPSASILANGKTFTGSMRALFKFSTISTRLNGVVGHLDGRAAAQYQRLRKVSAEHEEYLSFFHAIDPSYWPGRVVLFNRQTPPHWDTRNPPAEWTPMHAGGTFTEGGELFIEELNLLIRYLPGDLIVIRGHFLKHSVRPWSGGQRISVVYFSHEAFWKYFGLCLDLCLPLENQ